MRYLRSKEGRKGGQLGKPETNYFNDKKSEGSRELNSVVRNGVSDVKTNKL